MAETVAGLRLGWLGYGATNVGNLYRPMTDDDAWAVLETAWESGIRCFDTAPHYSDGRYVAFTRRLATGDNHVLVWDSATSTIVADRSIGNLGPLTAMARHDGDIWLGRTPVLVLSAQLSTTGLITARLLQASGVGILVQRIVGRHRVLGALRPRLRTVGRVPLGSHRKGRLKLRWNLRVNGRRLRAGRYQVTVRAVRRDGRLRDLARPVRLTIRKRSG